MHYHIEMKEIEPIRVAYTKFKGYIPEANKILPDVFKSIRGKTTGAPLFNYLSMDSQSKIGVIELCVPTQEKPIGNGIEVKELPRMKALCMRHIGSYERLSMAYDAIEAYSLENSISLTSPFRKVFIKGPGMFFKGNPKKYITEAQICIMEEN